MKVYNYTIGKLAGTDHGLYVRWKFSNGSKTDSFEIDWKYSTGATSKKNGKTSVIWFPGSQASLKPSEASVGGTTYSATWTAPDDAIQVMARIMAVSGTKNDKNKTKYFKSEWTSFGENMTYDFRNDKVSTPTVSAEMNDKGTVATITVECDDLDAKFCDVYAYEGSKCVKKIENKPFDESYTTTLPVTAGRTWGINARCQTDAKKFTKATSSWSTRQYVTARPSKPTMKQAKPVGSEGTRASVTWAAVKGATSYKVQYVADQSAYFDTNPEDVRTVDGITSTKFLPTDLESGHTWFFRVCAVNDGGDSNWSNVKSCMVATVPDAPTTFDTEPVVIVGNASVRFRWVHNSEDESAQTEYQIQLDIYDSNEITVTKEVRDVNVSASDGTFVLPSDFAEIADHHPMKLEVSESDPDRFSYIEYSFKSSLDKGTTSFSVFNPNKPTPMGGWVSFDAANHVGDMSAELALLPPSRFGKLSDIKITGFKYYTHHTTQTLSGTTDSYRMFQLSGLTDGAVVKWRVRTKGAHSNWSPWSIIRSFSAYTRPNLLCSLSQTSGSSVTPVDDGSSPLASLPLSVTLDASGGGDVVSGYHVSVVVAESTEYTDLYGSTISVVAGTIVHEADCVTGDDPFVAEIGAEAGLVNSVTYEVLADVSMASGLRTSADPARFVTDFEAVNANVSIPVSFDEYKLAADMWPACYDLDANGEMTDTLTDGVELSVYRIETNGMLTLLASGIENSGNVMVTDPHAAFGMCEYRAVAMDPSTGASVYEDGADSSPHATCAIQWNESWRRPIDGISEGEDDREYTASIIDGLYNLQFSESSNIQADTVEYIGREFPVSYYGTQQGYTTSYQLEFPRNDSQTLSDVRRLMKWHDDVYIREPSGTGFWANLTSTSLSYESKTQVMRLNVSAKRVDRSDDAVVK